MAKTFTNEPLTKPGRHEVKTERGLYIMGPSSIDTTDPSDMMDHDFTQTINEAKEAANQTHAMWAAGQVR